MVRDKVSSRMSVLHIGFPIAAVGRAFSRRHHNYEYIDWQGLQQVDIFSRIVNLHQECSFDACLLHLQADVLAPEVLEWMESQGISVLNWTWDIGRELFAYTKRLAPHCTSGFTNRRDVASVREMGHRAEWLPHGFDDAIFSPFGPTGDWPEVVFMGNNYRGTHVEFPLTQDRIDAVGRLSSELGSRFGVYGFGWDNPMQTLMNRESREAEAYRSCKVAVSMSHFSEDGYTSDRVLRAMGAGAMVLAQRWPGMDDQFRDHYHLVAWDTVDELLGMVRYYTSERGTSDRRSIAAAGCSLVHLQHRWDEVVRYLEDMVFTKKNLITD